MLPFLPALCGMAQEKPVPGAEAFWKKEFHRPGAHVVMICYQPGGGINEISYYIEQPVIVVALLSIYLQDDGAVPRFEQEKV